MYPRESGQDSRSKLARRDSEEYDEQNEIKERTRVDGGDGDTAGSIWLAGEYGRRGDWDDNALTELGTPGWGLVLLRRLVGLRKRSERFYGTVSSSGRRPAFTIAG